MKKVLPKTYLIGFSQIDLDELENYLKDTDQEEFMDLYYEAEGNGISAGTILCSFYAKLCYKSLVLGKNANISKIRGIMDNFESIIESAHGAVCEHFCLNFVTTNCSRIMTHELCRHRVGTAYSQTSGRYVALGVDSEENPVDIDMIIDPVIKPAEDILTDGINYLMQRIREARQILDVKNKSFHEKKKLTSALRRFAPNGQANEIGFSLNLRSLRNIIQQRTNRAAEWEIRLVFNQVADIIDNRWPKLLYGGKKELVEGTFEWTNLEI